MPADINGQDDNISIRETLAAEIERASAPEQADVSPPSAEPVEAPTDPAAAEQAAADQRARDDKGRFSAKDGELDPKAGKGAKAPVAAAAAAVVEPAPVDATKPVPPPGWSPASKAAWHDGKLPPEVIRDIAKRETEVNNGLAKLREYRPLDQYVEMAKQANTTLPDALERYVAAEQQLERNPVQGIAWLAKNYNVDPRELVKALGVTEQIPQPNGLAAPTAPQGASGQPQPQYQPQQVDLRPHISPIVQELEQLKRMVYGDKEAQTQSKVASFFSDPVNRYAENVADQMAALIRTGQASDLKEAYDTACWMNPEVRAELMKEQRTKEQADQAAKAKQVASQARTAGRSITGAPASTQPLVSNSDDLRATLEEQFRGSARA